MTQLTLHAPTLVGLHSRPAQDVEVLLAGPDGHRVKRRYTIRRSRPTLGEIDLQAHLHEHGGPGSTWAREAPVGSEVEFKGPRGKLELRPADWYLFVGDEAATPAIGALTEALGYERPVLVLAEVTDATDEAVLPGRQVRWLHRGGTPAGTPDLLGRALASLPVPPGVGHAFLLGESRAMKVLRGRLAELGVAAEHTFVKGYWNL